MWEKLVKRDQPIEKRYLWSFFMLVLVIDLLLTITLFFVFCSVEIRQTSQSSCKQLEQVCVSTDILYESLEAVVNQIQVDSDIITFLNSSKTDRLQEVTTGIKIRSIRTANPYLRYVTVYNASSQRFISSAAAGYAETLDASSFYEQLGNHSTACFFRSIGADNNIQPVKMARVYTFIFPLEKKPGRPANLVIIDVNDSYFDKAITPMCVSEENHRVFLQDRDTGSVIVQMDSQAGESKFSTAAGEASLSFSLPDPAGSGSFSYWDSGSLKLATYSVAGYADWIIYSVLPWHTLFRGFWAVMLLTLALSALTLGLGFVLSSQISASLSAPIKVLFENYVSSDRERKGDELELLSQTFSEMYSKADRLEQGLISSYHESRNLYLRYLLSGERAKVQSSLEVYQRLEIPLDSPYYATVQMECISQQPEPEEEGGQQRAHSFISNYALENMTRELISPVCPMEFIPMEENRFLLLLYLREKPLPPELPKRLETIANTMRERFRIDVTVCIGNLVTAWRDINLACEQTLVALRSQSVGHYGKVFFSGDSPETLSSELYFNGLRQRLAELVRSENMEACAEEFDRALVSISDVSFRAARSYFHHVLMSLVDDFFTAFERDDAYFAQMMEQLDKIDKCNNVQSLRAQVLSFLSGLSLRLSINRKSSNQEAALQAKRYIDANFSDPDLSLRMLAEKIKISPAYLGKVFTAVTTYSFNDYLNNARTAKAAELLTSTELPVSKISEQVGILNTNYFYSLFKKRYGVTPIAYRKGKR